MWSMGIILYKMLYGKEPFNGKDEYSEVYLEVPMKGIFLVDAFIAF